MAAGQRGLCAVGHRGAACLVAVVLAAATVAGQAPSPPAAGASSMLLPTLRRNNLTMFAELLEIAGVRQPSTSVNLTVFAPSNKALEEFLEDMDLTMADMRKSPGLAAAVCAYHILPRVKAGASYIRAIKPRPTRANPVTAITADGVYSLTFYLNDANRTIIVDAQNNSVSITQRDIDAGHALVHVIDRVLLSGDVYLTLNALLKSHPSLTAMRAIVERVGLMDELNSTMLTVFAPTNEAFAAAGPRLARLSREQQRAVVLYNMLPGSRVLPADFKPGVPYSTLLRNQTLQLRYTEVRPQPASARGSSSSNTTKAGETPSLADAGLNVYVLPNAALPPGAKPPHVVLANMFANQVVVHGIDAVAFPDLSKLPSGSVQPELPSAAAPSPVGSTKPATPAPAAPAAPRPSTGRRRLAQSTRRPGLGGMTVNTLALTNTQSAIRAAVDGRATASQAAGQGTFQAQAASIRCFNCVTDIAGPWGVP